MDVNVSIFENAYGGSPKIIALSSVVEDIRSGRHASQIGNLRALLAAGDRTRYDRDKKSLPAFTISGTCSDRKTMASHSGLIQADMDRLNGNLAKIRDKAKADYHVVAGFVSPSGSGLKLAVRVPANPERHREYFEAVERYILETYGQKIDGACKDPLRLCFVSSDPQAWLNEEAIELNVEQWSPLLAEPGTQLRQSFPPRTGDIIVLPSGATTISDSATDIFARIAPTHTMFRRGRTVFEINEHEDGNLMLADIKAPHFRSRVEKHGVLMAWREEQGTLVLKRRKMSDDDARAILAAQEVGCLPNISRIVNAPVLMESGEKMEVLCRGWHDHAGGIFVLKGDSPPVVPIEEATGALLDLLVEFDFVAHGDKSRAVASLLTPALKLGGWITGHHPADVAEADKSQSGKTYRQKLVMALYNERPYFVARRIGGVGSLDESYSQALLSGRPFVMIDNLRGRLDSQLLEMALTAGGHIPCRTPGRAEIMVDVRNVFHLLTSNGVETTADFANRSSIIRLRKRHRHTFRHFDDGDLLSHVAANQSYYMGCVFSVIEQWKAHGKKSTGDTRHDFRGPGRSIGSSRRFLGLLRFSKDTRRRNGVCRTQQSHGYA